MLVNSFFTSIVESRSTWPQSAIRWRRSITGTFIMLAAWNSTSGCTRSSSRVSRSRYATAKSAPVWASRSEMADAMSLPGSGCSSSVRGLSARQPPFRTAMVTSGIDTRSVRTAPMEQRLSHVSSSCIRPMISAFATPSGPRPMPRGENGTLGERVNRIDNNSRCQIEAPPTNTFSSLLARVLHVLAGEQPGTTDFTWRSCGSHGTFLSVSEALA